MQNNQQPDHQRHPFAVRRADKKPLTHSGVGEGDSSLPPIDHGHGSEVRPFEHPVFAAFSPEAKEVIDRNAAALRTALRAANLPGS